MTLKKFLSRLVLIASIVVLVAFTGIAVSVWYVRGEVDRRAERVLKEATAALDRAQPAARLVRETLDGAQSELQTVQRPARPDPMVPTGPKLLLRSALKQSPGRVESAARAVDVIGDLLVVANVALDAVDKTPGVAPVNADEVTGLREKLAASATALHEAEALLRPAANEALAAEDLAKIEAAIAQGRSVVGDVEGKLAAVRGKVDAFHDQYPATLRAATWGIFVLSVFGAFGQIALARWCLS